LLPIAGVALLTAGPILAQAGSQDMGQPPPGSTTTHTTKTKTSKVPESQLRKLTVKVRDVDPAQHTVIFEAHVSPEAQVTSGGQKIKIDNLKPGDEIRASFDPKTGDVVKLETIKSRGGESKEKGDMPKDMPKDKGDMPQH
jgi:hypothetical protein